jgi:hypothetical protein
MDQKETRHHRAVTSRAPTVPQMRSRFRRKGGILVLALASILNIAKAQAGPCTAAIKQFESGIRRSATNPDAGPMAPQTIGAQLGHQPTPASVGQAEKRAQGTFAAALERAKRFDASGDRTACMRALTRARRLYNL